MTTQRSAVFAAGAAAAVLVVFLGCKQPTSVVSAPDAGVASSASAADSAQAVAVAGSSAATGSVPSASAEPGAQPSDSGPSAPTSAAPHLTNHPRDGDGGGATAAGGDASVDAGASRPRVTLDESSEGKTLELSPGQQLMVSLDANPSTGFDWAVVKAPAALGSPEMGYVSSSNVTGAPGKRHLTWTVKAALPAGDHAVELGYARSFERGVPPFKTFRFKIRAASSPRR